jgi:hypothetical protein
MFWRQYEMQTPAAAYITEINTQSRQAWSPPRLRIDSIAAITHSGSVSATDGCVDCGRDGT